MARAMEMWRWGDEEEGSKERLEYQRAVLSDTRVGDSACWEHNGELQAVRAGC